MPQKWNKLILALLPMLILEFSIILAGFWMMGDYDQIRFGVWQMSEWLINYQGGFVRRGLVGELLYQLHPERPLIPVLNHLTFLFYLIYCTIFIFIYWLGRVRNRVVLIISLLIPGGIFQMAISASFFTRKEILFLILLGLLCLLYLYIGSKAVSLRKQWLFLFSALAILGGLMLTFTHEAYLFMGFPYVLTLFWVLKKENAHSLFLKRSYLSYLFAIPLVFLICAFDHGSVGISQEIWDSLTLADRVTISPHAPYSVYGAIGGIGWGALQNLSTLYGVFITGGWPYWIFFALGNCFVLIYILRHLAFNVRLEGRQQFIQLVLLPFLLSLSMFIVGSDWGRWLASAGNQALILAFALSTSTYISSKCSDEILFWPNSWLLNGRLIGCGLCLWLIAFYELIFKLPECCIEYPHIFIQYLDFYRAIVGA